MTTTVLVDVPEHLEKDGKEVFVTVGTQGTVKVPAGQRQTFVAYPGQLIIVEEVIK